jgi:hypothetical protein
MLLLVAGFRLPNGPLFNLAFAVPRAPLSLRGKIA